MSLNQEVLRLIFGLKLKGLRLDRGLSLKEMSEKTGLSASYLNEIEKGKKYPRQEKLQALALALNESFEDLTSTELKKELEVLQKLIDNKVFTEMPLEVFGLPSQVLFELLAEHPKKMQALIGTLLEVARVHSVEIKDVIKGFLRSFLDLNKNYFPSLEEEAKKLRALKSWPFKESEAMIEVLKANLEKDYQVKVIELSNLKTLENYLDGISWLRSGKGDRFYIDSRLSTFEKKRVLAQEFCFRWLTKNSVTVGFSGQDFESFDQILNNHSAQYLACAFLVEEPYFKNQVADCLEQKTFSSGKIDLWLSELQVPPAVLYQRLAQLFPRYFNVNQFFLLEYTFDNTLQEYNITDELHLSSLHAPHRIKGREHYCRRWLVHSLVDKVRKSPTLMPSHSQVSLFWESNSRYWVLGTAWSSAIYPGDVKCVCLGLSLEGLGALKESADLVAQAKVQVGSSCERCSLPSCEQRQAPFDQNRNPDRNNLIHQWAEKN